MHYSIFCFSSKFQQLLPYYFRYIPRNIFAPNVTFSKEFLETFSVIFTKQKTSMICQTITENEYFIWCLDIFSGIVEISTTTCYTLRFKLTTAMDNNFKKDNSKMLWLKYCWHKQHIGYIVCSVRGISICKCQISLSDFAVVANSAFVKFKYYMAFKEWHNRSL